MVDVPNPKSGYFEVNNWQLSELVVGRLVPVVGWHPFPLSELMLMAGAVAYFQPDYIFEWGTHIGKSARVFYETCQALGLKTRIHSIDLPENVDHNEHPHEQRGQLVKGLRGVELHEGDGLETALAILNQNKVIKGRGTLFFVDGDHDYKSVKRELSSIIEQAPLAAILLHDTFLQTADAKYNTGPRRAVDDCLAKTKHHYNRIDTATGLPGMTLLYSSPNPDK